MPAQPKEEKDEPVKVPLDPEEALRTLLRVKPTDDDKDDSTKPQNDDH